MTIVDAIEGRRIPCTFCGRYGAWYVARWNHWFCDEPCARAWDKERRRSRS